MEHLNLSKWIGADLWFEVKEVAVRRMYSEEILYKGNPVNVPHNLLMEPVEHVTSLHEGTPVYILR